MPWSLFSVHPRILMDLPRPPRLIPRSPWNFYQFLSSNVPRSSFLKFPEDPDDSSSLFLYRIFIVFLWDCLSYLSFFSLSRSLFLSTVPSSLIFFLHLRSSSCHRPSLYYCSSMLSFFTDLFSCGLFLSSYSSLASFFFLRQPGDLQQFLRATSSLYAPVEDSDER